MIVLRIHTADARGNIITLRQPGGLQVVWKGREITVPEGFESDGCSVPRILWGVVSPAIHPETIRASLVHDYIYRTHPEGWSKEEADELFYDLMIEDGFSRVKAYLAYKGVDWFGQSSWEGETN